MKQKNIIAISCVLLFFSVSVLAAEIKRDKLSASITIDHDKVKLGEPILVTIRLQGTNKNAYGLEDAPNLEPFVELGRNTRIESTDGKEVNVVELKVACFEKVGKIELPSIHLIPRTNKDKGLQLIELPTLSVSVVSMLEGADDIIPRDIVHPFDVYVPDFRVLVILGISGLWLVLGWVAVRRRSRVNSHKSRFYSLAPPRLAHEIALEKLRAIIKEDLLRQNKVQLYFVRISETVREYIGNRYGFFALDLTTRELVAELAYRSYSGLDLDRLKTMLDHADLVKFANYHPSTAVCSRVLDDAFHLVESTKLVEEQSERVSA